jgi:hypothetical protein
MREKDIPAQDFVVVGIEINVVLFEVRIELIGAQNLGNLHKLVVIVAAVEKRLFPKDLKRGDRLS